MPDTDVPSLPYGPAHGAGPAFRIALIDESLCIGCTLCIQACPVDAILGASQFMHTVIEADCTGCERCLAPCPVDCITMVPTTRQWTDEAERIAGQRHAARQQRLATRHHEHDGPAARTLANKPPPVQLDENDKQDRIARALARARMLRT
ncbi:RnfABCDGE type electron transport complex subunit B [Castellaniella sp.]|uniref:RnfABCDGE type electron transport complex subunit B n=1 Tax=Castellaniella sp. TaxID=1955812 RepID=UPI00355E90BB